MRTNGDREVFPGNMAAGLTKRELLAGLALVGLLARKTEPRADGSDLVREAVGAADALLHALGQARQREAPDAAAVCHSSEE
jgi:hypothetical protein